MYNKILIKISRFQLHRCTAFKIYQFNFVKENFWNLTKIFSQKVKISHICKIKSAEKSKSFGDIRAESFA
ncbi:hypothetical protein KUTeg_024288 [Tegillarca granosa]|uniref:Uncharacterized protein n=1 Tax=Tegillarca granosa TaxID=220873 RepID=A0ABQ9DXM3_TEGGR|nr:hypothetical protein KUTeg_024288 [Tegillarca granosa]